MIARGYGRIRPNALAIHSKAIKGFDTDRHNINNALIITHDGIELSL